MISPRATSVSTQQEGFHPEVTQLCAGKGRLVGPETHIFSMDRPPIQRNVAFIKEWPAPKSATEVKSFLQTVKSNSKFLTGQAGEISHPELTS